MTFRLARPLHQLWRVLALVGISSTAVAADAIAPNEELVPPGATDTGPAIERADSIRNRLLEAGRTSSDPTSRQYAQWSNWRN